jgi:RNA polymerase sigma-70 factor, ECF subfamily
VDGRTLADNDEKLMVRIGAGDHDAFRHVLEQHLARIVALAGRLLGDRTAAEDIAQDTFMRLWRHAARWHPSAQLGTWLYRVTLNLCLDRLSRIREVGLDDVAEPVDPRPSPIARLQGLDIGRHVNEALAQLPDQQRVAIALCHYEGLHNREAAELMGVSVEALESLLARGRRALRVRLRPVLPDLLGEE